MFEFTDEIGEPFFELSQFLSAIFGQDFALFYADEPSGVRDFIAYSSQGVQRTVVAELDDLLRLCGSEDELRDAIRTLGAAYMPPGAAPTHRNFILRVRRSLIESLAEMPTRPEETHRPGDGRT